MQVEVIPNGVDIDYFSPGSEVQNPGGDGMSIGVFGCMSFPPNADGVLYLVDEILPKIRRQLPDLKLYVVGRKPPEAIRSLAHRPGVIVTGDVDDMREYYRRVSVVVSPTRLGSGIKNTVLQAMSMAKSVVATSQSIRAIESDGGEYLAVADEPREFAERVIALLRDAALRHRMGSNARKLIERKYSWDAHAAAFQRLYEGICLHRSQVHPAVLT